MKSHGRLSPLTRNSAGGDRALALAAGLAGGITTQRTTLQPVFAQAQAPIPREIRTESLVIVDENGKPRAAFGTYDSMLVRGSGLNARE